MKEWARNGRLKRVVILTRGLLGGCAAQACAVKDRKGKTPLQWAEENKAPEEVLSLLRAASAIQLDPPAGWGELLAKLPGITSHFVDESMGDDSAQALCASLAAHAPSLVTLDLSRNGLTAVPPAVCDIVSLQTLNLSGNTIAELPPEMLRLTDLT